MDYNEKIKIVRKAIEDGVSKGLKEILLEQFPELKESEDERIRKEIINFLRSPFVTENITDEKIAPWVTYLEKHKEQNEELVYRLNGLMQEYINESKDEVEQEHRFRCYKLFWNALEDTSYFDEQKEQESNDLARLILLYADRSADVENVAAVFRLLREMYDDLKKKK